MDRERDTGFSRYNFSAEERENLILFAADGDSEKVREIEETLEKDPFFWEVVMRVSPTSLGSSTPNFFGPRREFIEPDDPAVERGIQRRSQGNEEKALFFRSIAAQEHLFREFYKHPDRAPEGFYPSEPTK